MQVTKVMYMLWVSDMDKSIGFYRDVIGLDVQVQSPGWSELAFGNATVALHLGRDENYRMTASTSKLAPLTTPAVNLRQRAGVSWTDPTMEAFRALGSRTLKISTATGFSSAITGNEDDKGMMRSQSEINDTASALVRAYPDKAIGFISAHPNGSGCDG